VIVTDSCGAKPVSVTVSWVRTGPLAGVSVKLTGAGLNPAVLGVTTSGGEQIHVGQASRSAAARVASAVVRP
jgi:hypothetical protein